MEQSYKKCQVIKKQEFNKYTTKQIGISSKKRLTLHLEQQRENFKIIYYWQEAKNLK